MPRRPRRFDRCRQADRPSPQSQRARRSERRRLTSWHRLSGCAAIQHRRSIRRGRRPRSIESLWWLMFWVLHGRVRRRDGRAGHRGRARRRRRQPLQAPRPSDARSRNVLRAVAWRIVDGGRPARACSSPASSPAGRSELADRQGRRCTIRSHRLPVVVGHRVLERRPGREMVTTANEIHCRSAGRW